jgi:amino acid adenylation domain-containing protein/non-ribosomal peptide synthase protein (TIGR01720 family)
LHEGQLFIAGRLKDLIIIRGLNYYPHDIERTVEQCHAALRPGCGAAISFLSEGEERLGIIQEIDAEPHLDLDDIVANIIQVVTETHDLQPHAVALIEPGSIPKTSSGKIRRFASRGAFLAGNLPVLISWQAPSAPNGEINPPAFADSDLETEDIETRLQLLVAAKLGIAPYKVDADQIITRYGLDSLSAIELMHGIEESLKVSLPLTMFFEDSSIADLANEIKRQRAAGDSSASEAICESPDEPVAAYPLSRGQRALWFIHQATPENTAYNIAGAARVVSTLNFAALRKAFQALTNRHACLRTVFVSSDGPPIQRVLDDLPVSFQYEDAANWDEASVHNYLAEQSSTPFDLSSGPLMRIAVIKRSAEDHILMLAIHHIVADFRSLAVLVDELAALYQAEITACPAQLPPSPSEYASFVRWQEQMLAGDEGKRLEAYWLERLSGELPILNLPIDRMRPSAQTYRGASQFFKLNAGTSQRLRELSKSCGTTLYMTLLVVFQTLLHRYTGDNDIILGSPMAGRSKPGMARTIGYFINMVVLRASLDGNPSFEKFLQQVRQVVLGAFQHQHYPFDLLIEKLQPERDPSLSPIFQVMFVFLKSQSPHDQSLASFALGESETRIKLGELELEPLALPKRASQFDLTLIMAEADDLLLGNIEYNTDIFDSVTIKRLSTHLQNVIESILDDPTRQISNLSLLTRAEAHQLLVGWNDTATEWTPDVCLHDAVEAQVRKCPDATAVAFDDEALSFKQLDSRANQLARYLRRLGTRPGAPVGVFVERSPEMVISILAVLKAGAAYLPLDPNYPRDRLTWMLDDAGAKILITHRNIYDRLAVAGLDVVRIDADWDEVSKESCRRIDSGVTAEDLAYVIYTSGSSGKPKGVMISHRAICNRLMWMQSTFQFTGDDRVLQKTPTSFDASVWELFMPLMYGAKLVMARPGGHQDSDYLVRATCEEGVTILQLVPTMLQVLLDEPEVERCKSLRLLYSGGEALPVDIQKKYFGRIGKRLINLYGPTETAIDATYWDCNQAGHQRSTPIGWPIANNQVYLLDRFLNPVAIGLAGELCVGGYGLGRGYLNRPDLTAERFIPNPFGDEPGSRLYRTGDLAHRLQDGRIEFLGRLDFQVKVRGFRIELGEIESRLMQHPLIREAVVIAMKYSAPDSGAGRAANDNRLVAYVTTNDPQPIPISDLREYIKEALPEYMVPAAFVFLDSLPITSNGKLDRRALPVPREARPELAGGITPARNLPEKILAGIWSRALGLEKVGIHDNFFELGGDSILSIQIVARARQAGLIFNARDLFRYQTIAELANVARSVRATQAEQGAITGSVPLTPIQRWFFGQNFLDAHHWNQFVLLESKQPLDAALLEHALRDVLRHHDVLRSRFNETANGWQQVIAGPDKAITLATVDLAGMAERERAFAIESWTGRVQASLSLSDGRLASAVHFKGGEDADRLLMVIHHLVTDAFSWRIILEDLNTAYNQLGAHRQVELPPKTTSFKRWAEEINQYAESGSLDEELTYWQTPEARTAPALPVDYPEASNTVASAATVSMALDEEETRALLQEAVPAFRTRADELLLAALLLSYEEWSGNRVLLIDVEGHGREEVVCGIDLSRTVGWFTSTYPLLLRAVEKMTPSLALRIVKERVRAVPRKGIGYGLLRYCGRREVREQMQPLPPARIIFNFLGDLDQALRESSLFSTSRRVSGLSAGSSSERPYLIEIEGSIIEGCLQMKWTYSKEAYRQTTIERAIRVLLKAIRQLIEEGCSVEAEGLVPSDFTLANLDQNKLNKLYALLRKKS